MAWVKLDGVGADLPLLQPEMRIAKASVEAVNTYAIGFLRTVFIASPVGLTCWMQRGDKTTGTRLFLISILNLFRERVEFADGLHGVQGFKVCLNLGPLLRIFFGDDGGFRIRVVGDEIVFELVGDNFFRVLGNHI